MKKNIALFSGFILTIVLTSVVTGKSGLQNIKVNYRNIKINVNNKQEKTDLEPFIFNESTYVPLRFVSEKLNTKVTWDDDTSTISIVSDNNANTSVSADAVKAIDTLKAFVTDAYDVFRVVEVISIKGTLYYKVEASHESRNTIYVYYNTSDSRLYNYENGDLSIFQ